MSSGPEGLRSGVRCGRGLDPEPLSRQILTPADLKPVLSDGSGSAARPAVNAPPIREKQAVTPPPDM